MLSLLAGCNLILARCGLLISASATPSPEPLDSSPKPRSLIMTPRLPPFLLSPPIPPLESSSRSLRRTPLFLPPPLPPPPPPTSTSQCAPTLRVFRLSAPLLPPPPPPRPPRKKSDLRVTLTSISCVMRMEAMLRRRCGQKTGREATTVARSTSTTLRTVE